MNKVLRSPEEIEAFLGKLEERLPGEDAGVQASVRQIIGRVQQNRREGVLGARLEFEGESTDSALVYRLRKERETFRGDADLNELMERAQECEPKVERSLHLSVERVRAYHRIQMEESRSHSDGTARRGHFESRVQPLDSVAVYVPGGKAFYPSSVIMSVVPAQVAGVERIAIVTPARSLANPTFAATLKCLGVEEVLATGGAQGVAAAAFGFDGFDRCDKIVGPGNAYVATAKHLLSGRIGIDSFAGPSEIVILSDGSSPPDWVVADLLAQAEHDEEASSVLITTSASEAHEVCEKMESAFANLRDRTVVARSSWRSYGAVILVDSRDQQVELANRLHAEHLQVHTQCALEEEGRKAWSQDLRGVGAVFFGRYCAEVFGDYLAGPSHVLPTAGTARFSSPLGVHDFVRRSSLLWMSAELGEELAEATAVFAESEGLWAHAHAAWLRARPAASASRVEGRS